MGRYLAVCGVAHFQHATPGPWSGSRAVGSAVGSRLRRVPRSLVAHPMAYAAALEAGELGVVLEVREVVGRSGQFA